MGWEFESKEVPSERAQKQAVVTAELGMGLHRFFKTNAERKAQDSETRLKEQSNEGARNKVHFNFGAVWSGD